MAPKTNDLNLPNALCVLRLALVPVLVGIALFGDRVLFAMVFLLGGITDVLDGFLARKLNCVTALGNKLDTFADIAFYPTALLVYFLVPEVKAHIVPALIAVAFMGLAMLWCGFKGKFDGPHPIVSKVCGCFIYMGVVYVLLVGFSVWVFYLMLVAGIVSAINRVSLGL
ncbi:MAG TPA: CDP-alcohol phosphatidyltransferase family protein [Candidatus Nanoarchaeia archaeon]|nr:CDP-alcohol phosphatidyltransferase family protein [Candidatus Nanoarchaeia archaeon]